MRMLLRSRSLWLVLALVLGVARPAAADGTPQTLPFMQDWSNTGLITADNVWTNVPGVVGYNGTGMGTSGTADPQTLLGTGTESLQVLANQTMTTITNGGVAEFDALPNPVVAFQGSGTAGAPNLVITVNTTGATNIHVTYTLRDLDGVDDTTQRVALQYRVGTTGTYTNIAAGYVPDATMTGATFTTMVNVTLPVACENQPLVELRIITANAPSADEWVGVDDIVVSATPTTCGNGTMDAGEACDTGAANGTTPCGCTTACQLRAAGASCGGAPSGACDAQDTCDGAGVCAPRVATSTTACHPSTGPCDPVENCDGTTTVCPPDLRETAGTMCAAAAGLCDPADTCDGTSAACPPNVAANGTPCTDDGVMCNGTEQCMAGACAHVSPPNCADTDACTDDVCMESTPMCMHTVRPAPGCCNVAADCDDGDACTTNACTAAGGVCTFDPIPDCCTTQAACDDGDACTTDTCDGATHTCAHAMSCIDGGAHDAGAVDAGRDGGPIVTDGSITRDVGHGTPHTSSGCACTAAGSGSSRGAWLLLAGLALLVTRRRISAGAPASGRRN